MRSSDYWKERFEQLEAAQNRKGINTYLKIEKQYKKAERELEGQIAKWYQRFAANNQVTLADARRMLTNQELEELKWDVEQYIQYGKENAINGAWIKQLENASARYHISRLEAIQLQMQQSLEVMFGNQLDSIDFAMRDIYQSGYYHTAFEVQKGVGIGWSLERLDERTIEKVINRPWASDGRNFSQRIWGNRQKLINELNTTLVQNIILGQDPAKAINAIAKRLNVSRSNAGALVMTEEAYFSSLSQKDCFNELDVEEFEVVATLDSHTSDICRHMDGEHFPMSQWEVGTTAPPFHVRCRSTTVPYFGDEFDAVGERAARGTDGKTYYVPADMTYEQWEKAFVGDGDKSVLQEVESDDILDLKTRISNMNAQIRTLKEEFGEVTEGYSYTEWFNEFDSIEEGFGGADEDDESFVRLKEIDQKIRTIQQQKKPLLYQKEKRPQLDTGYPGRIPADKLDEYNAKGLEQIKLDTGYSPDQAEELHAAFKEYFGGNYEEILTGSQETAEIISDGIDTMPVYEGTIYRGLYFSDTSDADVSLFTTLESGDRVPAKGILSSWSNNKRVAEAFGGASTQQSEASAVILECLENKTGVGVQHLSGFGVCEAEVLSNANYEVVEVTTVSKYDYVAKRKDLLLFPDDLNEHEEELKKRVVCIIKVKEV